MDYDNNAERALEAPYNIIGNIIYYTEDYLDVIYKFVTSYDIGYIFRSIFIPQIVNKI